MKRMLLDTSVLIDHLRAKDRKQTTLSWLVKSEYESAISIITHTELYAGRSIWQDQGLNEIVHRLCSGFLIYNIDINLSEKAGKIRAHYQLSLGDAIIAATAIENDLELATLNQKDFSKAPGLKILNPKP